MALHYYYSCLWVGVQSNVIIISLGSIQTKLSYEALGGLQSRYRLLLPGTRSLLGKHGILPEEPQHASHSGAGPKP